MATVNSLAEASAQIVFAGGTGVSFTNKGSFVWVKVGDLGSPVGFFQIDAEEFEEFMRAMDVVRVALRGRV